MVKLEFSIYKDTVPTSKPIFEEDCMTGAFNGLQTFTINGVDFSGDVALLNFARGLRIAMRQIEPGNSILAFSDCDSEWKIYFKFSGDQVEVVEGKVGELQAKQAIASIPELSSAINSYAHRLYETCCDLCPLLDSEIGDWWRQGD